MRFRRRPKVEIPAPTIAPAVPVTEAAPVSYCPDESANKKDGQGHAHEEMRQQAGGERGFERGETASSHPLRERQAEEAAHRKKGNRSTAPQVTQETGKDGAVVARVHQGTPEKSPTRKDAEADWTIPPR